MLLVPALVVRVFMSYAYVDSAAAQEIEDRMRAAGCEVWRDTESLQGGDSWRSGVEHAIETADLVVVLISDASKASDNVGDELAYARMLKVRIVPVPLTTEKMPLILARLHWVRPKDVGKLCKGGK